MASRGRSRRPDEAGEAAADIDDDVIDGVGAGGTAAAAGCWIGVDWGTTNCAAAVYSRDRGRAKWMRLAGPAATGATGQNDASTNGNSNSKNNTNANRKGNTTTTKGSRIMPTVLVLATAEFVAEQQQQRARQNDKNNSNHTNSAGETPNRTGLSSTIWDDVSDLLHPDGSGPTGTTCSYCACVGAAAENFIANALATNAVDPAALAAATVRSVKREILGRLQQPPPQNTPPSSSRAADAVVRIAVTPLDHREHRSPAPAPTPPPPLLIEAVAIVAIFLRALRWASDAYLSSYRVAAGKRLRIPGDAPPCRHVCVGVPASSTVRYRTLVQEAAYRAGFASAAALTESTAAATAYGLFATPARLLSLPAPASSSSAASSAASTVLVFDMGGGTTDVTIAERNRASTTTATTAGSTEFTVCVTAGHERLGGDDMDQAILEAVRHKVMVQQQHGEIEKNGTSALPLLLLPHRQQQWLQQCRAAKVLLCGDGSDVPAADTAVVTVQGMPITITQADWREALAPILQSTRQVITGALERYRRQKGDAAAAAAARMDEVILIGGASRVPAVRLLLSELFPAVDLCVAVNAMSAVAQGCAVSAALASRTVPLHEVRSALMLDTSPHAIGVLTRTASGSDDDGDNPNNGTFVEVLPRDAPLPAAGYATFVLADRLQKGVTLNAVECVGNGSYSSLGEFTFLLHRLSKKQLAALSVRSIDIGMTLKTNGEFVVSIFDANDPDHARKKERYRRAKGEHENTLSCKNDAAVDDHPSIEQISLLVACGVLFLLYAVAKLAFADPDVLLENEASR